jgi:hypothetical protein
LLPKSNQNSIARVAVFVNGTAQEAEEVVASFTAVSRIASDALLHVSRHRTLQTLTVTRSASAYDASFASYDLTRS